VAPRASRIRNSMNELATPVAGPYIRKDIMTGISAKSKDNHGRKGKGILKKSVRTKASAPLTDAAAILLVLPTDVLVCIDQCGRLEGIIKPFSQYNMSL